MRKSIVSSLISLVVIILISGMAAADRLPNQTPENQVFSMASSVEATGSYSGSQSLQWTNGYNPGLLTATALLPLSPDDPIVGQWPNYGHQFSENEDDMYKPILGTNFITNNIFPH